MPQRPASSITDDDRNQVVEIGAATSADAADVATSHATLLRGCAARPDRDAARKEIAALTEKLLSSTGRGLDLTEANLSGLDLSGFDLRKAALNRAALHRTDLSDANLAQASLICPGMERTRLADADRNGAYVHALASQVCDFSGADLRNLVDATGALFHGCNMTGALLDGAALAGATFYQCGLEKASLLGAHLQGAVFNECFMDHAELSGALVSQLTITKCHLTGARLSRASGDGLVLQRLTAADGLDLRSANLRSLRLHSVRVAGLVAADLRGAKLDGASFHTCYARGVNLAEASAENLTALECAFPESNMSHLAGRCATFRDCDLAGANLRGAYLYRANLTGDPPRSMSLVSANLTDSVLVQAYITADLSRTSLRGAHCAYARLNQCVMREADLSGVNLYEASLVKVDCSDTRFTTIEPPIFAHRSPGLIEAIESAWDSGNGESMAGFLRNLEALLNSGSRGST